MTTLAQAKSAKGKLAASLPDGLDVNGIGITRHEKGFGLKLNLASPPTQDVTIPRDVDGVPVNVELVGRITKVPAR
jgi:hypothetical protein